MRFRRSSLLLFGLVLVVSVACFCHSPEETRENWRQSRREEPCLDGALFMTPRRFPDLEECPNRLHRIEFHGFSTRNPEDVGALVFCRCVPEQAPPLSCAGPSGPPLTHRSSFEHP